MRVRRNRYVTATLLHTLIINYYLHITVVPTVGGKIGYTFEITCLHEP